MSGRNGLISTAELADILGQADLRLFDCTTYLEPAPEGSSLPYLAVPGRHTFEAGHIPGADFLDLQGEFSDSSTTLRFMMPDVALSRASVRPSRRVQRKPGRALQHRHPDVGDAVLVDAHIARLRERRGARRRSRQMEARRPRARNRTGEGISARDIHGQTETGIFRRQARDARRHVRAGHGRRQRARPAVSQGAGAQPLRPARPCPRQLQRVGSDAARSPDQGFRPAWRRRKPNSRRRASRKTSAWSPIAAAASRRPSICSCCISLATTISPSTTARWANGPRTRRCRSRRASYAGTFGSGVTFGSGLFTR